MIDRRELLTAVLSATLFSAPKLGLAQTLPAPAGVDFSKWFRYGATIDAKWRVAVAEGNANLLTITSRNTPPSSQTKKVLVLYPRASSAYDTAITTILTVFDDKHLDVQVTVINFMNDDLLGKKAITIAEARKFDLILSMGSESSAWLWDNYRGGAIPVVTICSKDPVLLGQVANYDVGSRTNFAFTSLNMPVESQMAYVQELKQQLKNIAVLVDAQNVSAVETQAKPVIDYVRKRGIRVHEIAIQNPATAAAELEAAVKRTTAAMQRNDPGLADSVYWVTGSTSVFREIATINAYADRATVISVVPEVVRGGDDSAALSIGISFESNAHLAAVYASDILKGRAVAGDLKVGVVSPPDIAISFRKTRDIGMSVPFTFFEAAGTIYDYDGRLVRANGVNLLAQAN